MHPHVKSAGTLLFQKYVKIYKNMIFTGMYTVTNWNMYKITVFTQLVWDLEQSLHSSHGSVSDTFGKFLLNWLDDTNWWFSIISEKMKSFLNILCSGSYFKVLCYLKFYSILRGGYSLN